MAHIFSSISWHIIQTIGPLPDYPQTTVDKVASVIELDFVYLIVCLSVCGQIFSFLSSSSSFSFIYPTVSSVINL